MPGRTTNAIRRKVAAACALALLGGLGAGAGCGDSAGDRIRAATLSEGCLINSDCESPLVCAFRRCHSECSSTRDCGEGQRCVASDRPFRVCQLDEEKHCTRNSECPAPMVCGVDGQCRDQCKTARDCVAEQICVGGTCADTTELNGEGALEPSPEVLADDPEGSGTPCLYNSDCPDALVCRASSCVPECRVDIDCPRGYSCEGSVCAAAPASRVDAGACAYNSDCATGEICASGACVCQCRANVDCALGEVCAGCACEAAPEPPPVDAGSGGTGGVSSGGAGGTSTAGAGGSGGGASGCAYSSECGGGGQVCVSGACRCQCLADVDCATGDVCDGCGCVADIPPDAPPGYGSSCNVLTDCPSPLICGLAGECVFQCIMNVDCDPGFCCSVGHVCVTGSACDPAPVDAGAPSDGGTQQACSGDYECQDAVFCNGIERCVGGFCQAAGKQECDDGNPCTADTCDETAKTCSHLSSGPVDADNDGHYAIACGGAADDCDDTNPDVHPGHVELCDLLDNNCSGVADEGLWSFDAAKVIDDTASYPVGNGAPAIVRLDSGNFVVGAATDSLLRGWQLGLDLSVLAGPTTVYTPGTNYAAVLPTMATDGAGFLAGVARWAHLAGCYYNGDRQWRAGTRIIAGAADVTGLAVSSLGNFSFGCASLSYVTTGRWWAGIGSGSPADVAWNGTQYVYVWSDTHLSTDETIGHVFAGTATPSGTVTATRELLTDLTQIGVFARNATLDADATFESPSVPQIAIGTTRALVAWSSNDTGTARYAIFDRSLTSLLAGPEDLSGTITAFPTDATAVGADLYLATQSIGGRNVRVHRIDPDSAQVLATADIANPSGLGDARLAAVGDGVALAVARGTGVAFGRAPRSLAGGYALTELLTGSPSSASIAPIDVQSAAIAYSSGSARVVATIARCADAP